MKNIDAPRGTNAPTVVFETVDENAAEQRIDNFLLSRLKGVPKSHVYQILSSGQVRVNKKRVVASYRLKLDDLVRIPPVRTAAKATISRVRIPENTTLLPHILYEDESLIALNKPSGVGRPWGEWCESGGDRIVASRISAAKVSRVGA